MSYFQDLGILSFIGIALLLFFFLSFFIKKENLLTRTQRISYQNLKLEVTLNILVFLAGALFLYLDYENNYQKLHGQYRARSAELRDSVMELQNYARFLREESARKEKTQYEFLIRLTPVAGRYPEPEELECKYKETSRAPLKRAEIENSDFGGSEGTYKVILQNIEQFSTVPYIQVLDRRGNKWTSGENIEIRPPLVELNLQK